MADYNSLSKGNSQPQAEKPKEDKKIISGKARVKHRMIDSILPDDISSLLKRSFETVVVPYLKRAFSDTINVVLFGESGSNKSSSGSAQYSYNNCYGKTQSLPTKSRKNYETIIFDNVKDAEDVIKDVEEEIGRYGIARVAYMYERAGITCDYTLNDIGWDDISGYKIIPTSDGWMLKMPKANPINR